MEFTKADLRNWDIVVTREGSRYLVNVEAELIQRNFRHRTFNQYASDLKIKNSTSGDGDIMEVYRGVRVINFTDLNECVLGDSNLVYNRNEKWQPKVGDKYYIPRTSRELYYDDLIWENDSYDNRMLERNIVFKTKEEAIKVAKKMLKALEGPND